jgi:hypothetical protein
VAQRGIRALRPTKPAGPVLNLAELGHLSPTQGDGLDFALGTLRRVAPARSTCEFWHGKQLDAPESVRGAKTGIIVAVGRPIVVALGRTHIV